MITNRTSSQDENYVTSVSDLVGTPFVDVKSGHLTFKTCNSVTNHASYFFADAFSAQSYFDEADFYSAFEKVTPFYISRPTQPIVFTANYFKDNIGTYGGSVTIHEPQFKHAGDYESVESRPYVVF